MYRNINIEAEHNELILLNSHGDTVIIPANKREWVKNKLKSGCHDCIDGLVSTLPVASQYAQDGTLFPSKEPITLMTPSGRRIDTDTDSDYYRTHYNSNLIGNQNEDKSWNLIDEIYEGKDLPEVTVNSKLQPNTLGWYKNEFEKSNPRNKFFGNKQAIHSKEFYSAPLWAQQAVGGYTDKRKANDRATDEKEYTNLQNNFIAEKLLQRTPFEGMDNRLKWMDKFTPEELKVIQDSKYKSELEEGSLQKFDNFILGTFNTSGINFKSQGTTAEEAKADASNPLNILQPLSVPTKLVQSVYKKDYSASDALKGKANNASIVEDIVTDPLNLVGLGIWGKLSKAGKFSKLEDVYQAVKGLSKEEATSKLIESLPKIKKEPLDINIEDLMKGISSTDRKNMTIIKEGDRYFKELNNPESLKRLKEFGDDYGIDLIDAYKKAEKRWDYGKNIGEHSNFKVKKTDEDWYGLSTYKDEYEHRIQQIYLENIYGKDSKQVKDFNKKLLQEKSINYISDKVPLDRYAKTIWHELSHDINKSIIGNSPKLQEEIKSIFIDRGTANLDNVKKAREFVAKDFYTKKDKVLSELNTKESLKKVADNEFDYVTRPTETWAFLSTNLRQDLKNTGVIADYNEVLTLEKLDKAIKNGNTVYSRFEPYIKDKKKFIELFNKMTLSIAPIAAYLQSQQNNK